MYSRVSVYIYSFVVRRIVQILRSGIKIYAFQNVSIRTDTVPDTDANIQILLIILHRRMSWVQYV